MNVEEFERATEKELRDKANEQFSKLETSETNDWAAHLLTAKFYMDEAERRLHAKSEKRNLGLELIAIFLELVVIVLIWSELAGNDEQLGVLNHLNTHRMGKFHKVVGCRNLSARRNKRGNRTCNHLL